MLEVLFIDLCEDVVFEVKVLNIVWYYILIDVLIDVYVEFMLIVIENVVCNVFKYVNLLVFFICECID